MNDLFVLKTKETLYLGLREGREFADIIYENNIFADMVLHKELQVEMITVSNRKTFEMKWYIVLDNGETLDLETEQQKIYDYFINKGC